MCRWLRIVDNQEYFSRAGATNDTSPFTAGAAGAVLILVSSVCADNTGSDIARARPSAAERHRPRAVLVTANRFLFILECPLASRWPCTRLDVGSPLYHDYVL